MEISKLFRQPKYTAHYMQTWLLCNVVSTLIPNAILTLISCEILHMDTSESNY